MTIVGNIGRSVDDVDNYGRGSLARSSETFSAALHEFANLLRIS